MRKSKRFLVTALHREIHEKDMSYILLEEMPHGELSSFLQALTWKGNNVFFFFFSPDAFI